MEAWFVLLLAVVEAKMYCGKNKGPLELGEWKYDLKHIDSAVVENEPVTINEGQMYVYQNYFPEHIIKYIHVDNLAIKSCGAIAEIRHGGIGNSSVIIVLHADMNQEIRSVVDIWGEKLPPTKLPPPDPAIPKSLHQFKTIRAVSHNRGN